MIVAVDPGLSGCGWALFAMDLIAAGYAAASSHDATTELADRWWESARATFDAVDKQCGKHSLTVDCVYCELPQIYTREKSPGDPNDLIALAGVTGSVLALAVELWGCDTFTVLPASWKRQLPHSVVEKRVQTRLSPAERVVLKAGLPLGVRGKPLKDLSHNVVDACGIGLHFVGRSLVE